MSDPRFVIPEKLRLEFERAAVAITPWIHPGLEAAWQLPNGASLVIKSPVRCSQCGCNGYHPLPTERGKT